MPQRKDCTIFDRRPVDSDTTVYGGVVDGSDFLAEFPRLDQRSFSRHGRSHAGGERLAAPGDLVDWLVECDLLAPGDELGPEDLTAAIALVRHCSVALR